MSKWKIDKNKTECPFCGNKNTQFKMDYLLSKPRPKYRCDECYSEWHYSRKIMQVIRH